MDKSLTDAANAAASKTSFEPAHCLTVTTAWEDVLATGLEFNFSLIKDLCSMKDQGHRVIITATTDKDVIRDMIALAVQFGAEQGHDVTKLNSFEFISKPDLMRLSANNQIHVDIALDSENIAAQSMLVRDGQDVFRQELHYVEPSVELHVGQHFAITPVEARTLDPQ